VFQNHDSFETQVKAGIDVEVEKVRSNIAASQAERLQQGVKEAVALELTALKQVVAAPVSSTPAPNVEQPHPAATPAVHHGLPSELVQKLEEALKEVDGASSILQRLEEVQQEVQLRENLDEKARTAMADIVRKVMQVAREGGGNPYATNEKKWLLDRVRGQITLLEEAQEESDGRPTGDGLHHVNPNLMGPSHAKEALVDPTALTPGKDWWTRPNPAPFAPRQRPKNWFRDQAKDKVRWDTITENIVGIMKAARTGEGKRSHSAVLRKLKGLVAVGERGASTPVTFSGAGVVIAGGGAVYFSSAIVVARTLRALGCYLVTI